jgi:hypothetical protein
VLLHETRCPASAYAVTRVDILISMLWGLFRDLLAARPSRATLLPFTDIIVLFYAKLSAFQFFRRVKEGLGGLGKSWEDLAQTPERGAVD